MAALNWPFGLYLRLLLRSFLLQASWNFSRLQNLGVLYMLLPALRALHVREQLAEACRRHLEYFNSHPYLVPGILGASLNLEREVANGRADAASVAELKQMVMAPYAAMGDAFFWGGVRPLAAGVALLLAWHGFLWAPLMFLALFNLPHLLFRAGGLYRGLAQGVGAIHLLQSLRLPDLAVRAKEATVILLGGLAALMTLTTVHEAGQGGFWGLLVLPAVILLSQGARRGWSTLAVLLTGSTLIALFGPMF